MPCRITDPHLAVLMSLTRPDSILEGIPLVEPFTGPLWWSYETDWAWQREIQWPEDERAIGRPR